MFQWLINLLFPPKCVLCRRVLSKNETYFCHNCRIHTPEFAKSKRKIPFVAQWTGIWYYKEDVAKSIQRYKFSNCRQYAFPYAQQLAIRLQQDEMTNFDLLSWIPVSARRKRKRGYDQGQLLAQALAMELGCTCTQVLTKTIDTPPQSGIKDPSMRRANVVGAYRICDTQMIHGKRILLLDDVLTTGATASECAKTLMFYGAKAVTLATVAVADKNK